MGKPELVAGLGDVKKESCGHRDMREHPPFEFHQVEKGRSMPGEESKLLAGRGLA